MFGGLAFLVSGHMAVTLGPDGLLLRVDPQAARLGTDPRVSTEVTPGSRCAACHPSPDRRRHASVSPRRPHAQSWPSRASSASSRVPSYAPVDRYFQPPSHTTKAMSARSPAFTHLAA